MNKYLSAVLFSFLTAGLFLIHSSSAQEGQFPALAKQIFNTSVHVKPGDVVVVSGGQRTIPLMESIAIEAVKAGGLVQMFLNTDRLTRAINADVPEQYLKQEPRYLVDWVKDVDVWIGLPDVDDSAAVVAGVSQQRLDEINRAGSIFGNTLNSAKLRFLGVNFPSKADAVLFQIPYDDLEKMHWDAVNTDYREILEKGESLRRMLEHSKSVRITSAKGTDLTFSVDGRPVSVDAGIVTDEKTQAKVFGSRAVTLPGGSVYVAPIETSGKGKVFSERERCRPDVQLVNASFDVEGGRIAHFQAESGGPCYEETMAGYSGPKDVLGTVSIGLNPALKVSENYRPDAAAGMVWIGFGNNEIYGGKNTQPGGFSFPVIHATVQVDGKTVVKDGQIVF